jgi:hypothetical protein
VISLQVLAINLSTGAVGLINKGIATNTGQAECIGPIGSISSRGPISPHCRRFGPAPLAYVQLPSMVVECISSPRHSRIEQRVANTAEHDKHQCLLGRRPHHVASQHERAMGQL